VPEFEKITSLRNGRIKQIRRLRDKRHRERENRFVIEYNRDLRRALDKGFTLDYALFAPEIADDDDHALLDRLNPAQVFEVTDEIMSKASYRQNPNGLIGIMVSQPVPNIAELSDPLPDVMLALVDLKKPGNIGALLRTADATGVGAILLIDTDLDLFNPNIIRSSTGACFLNNVYAANSAEASDFFHAHQVQSVAAVVDADESLYKTVLRPPSVILLGTEDAGLTDFWFTHADYQVSIPMVGEVADSLNVSVSGAVMMYEALRQRTLVDLEP